MCPFTPIEFLCICIKELASDTTTFCFYLDMTSTVYYTHLVSSSKRHCRCLHKRVNFTTPFLTSSYFTLRLEWVFVGICYCEMKINTCAFC